MTLLRIKSAFVDTPIGAIATELRWHAGAIHRLRFPEMLEASVEERRLPSVLQKVVNRPDANCADVGCHIGSFLSLIRKLYPSGRHAAVEASPTKAGWLKQKFPDVSIHNVAVADEAGQATFEDNISRPGYSRLLNGGTRSSGNSYYNVQVETLDRLLSDFDRIDLLKIDIEGGELNALKGATATIARTRPAILFEVGSEYMLDKLHISRRDLYEFFRGISYDVYTFTDVLFDREPIDYSEFRRCGLYPFRAFNFVARPRQ